MICSNGIRESQIKTVYRNRKNVFKNDNVLPYPPTQSIRHQQQYRAERTISGTFPVFIIYALSLPLRILTHALVFRIVNFRLAREFFRILYCSNHQPSLGVAGCQVFYLTYVTGIPEYTLELSHDILDEFYGVGDAPLLSHVILLRPPLNYLMLSQQWWYHSESAPESSYVIPVVSFRGRPWIISCYPSSGIILSPPLNHLMLSQW